MTLSRTRYARVMRRNERVMRAFFRRDLIRPLQDAIDRVVVQDKVPLTSLPTLQRETNRIVTSAFLGADNEPFQVTVTGAVRPRSPYMAALYGGIVYATRAGVEAQHRLMAAKLRRAPEVRRRLEANRVNPFYWARRLQEQLGVRPNPLARYEPAHTWVDPQGYRLSDRIWRTTGNTRRQIDLLLADGVANGRSATAMAHDLEPFLLPGRQLVRTTRPYGRDASFDAMRLARTEISRAAMQAQSMAAQVNPFVSAYNVVLSTSHPERDICDDVAADGPYRKDNLSRLPPLHPHCLCYTEWVVRDDADAIIGELRDEITRARIAVVQRQRPADLSPLLMLIGPLLVAYFVDALLRGGDTPDARIYQPDEWATMEEGELERVA